MTARRRGRRVAGVLGLVAAGLATGRPATAQDWQQLDARRAARDSAPLRVRLGYGAGTMRVRPAEPGVLYDVQLRYDAERVSPEVAWRPDARLLVVETRHDPLRLPSSDRASLDLALTRAAPLDLDVQLGAVSAALDLTGLRVRSLDFASGASDATVRFDTSGTTPLERLTLQVGAGRLRLEGLGPAQVRRVEATGGVGELVLDFSGAWRGDIDAEVTLAIGEATLRVPADVGVLVKASPRWLNRLSLPGFVERDGARVSPGYEQATRTLRVQLTSVLGTLRVERF